ncbi:efflux RND transporter periplasmic adaptor subunit [Dyadobacter sp. LHD-138]|uniref:efflux RND transporter periplasmic adaptor subunit n=1 Tax=Dyadobacter sp. LHD-138 TaxID=3071413 RepID=UPI0027E1CBE1|nr:efflux RND transporter periplasmic adaptor subunit [Dyadobacter sp. LHD-138]MDQ6481530.1 efflux RND transporter periplasmic adaptor subunit [Dyadobacter sp. LHD-138]
MKNLTFTSTLASMAILPFLYSCGSNPSQAVTADKPQEYPVETVVSKTTVVHIDYPANLQGQQNVEIRPKVDGFIEKILVDEGAEVKKGQLLFKINAPQYEQEVRTATAAIKHAEAEVNTAKIQVEKTIPLVKEEIISAYELKSAELVLQSREAALAQAKASLINARNNLGYTQITSPADGVVGSIPYKTGSLVSSSSPQPLTTVSNISKIFAYFSWNEKQFLDFTYNQEGKNIKEKLIKFPEVTLLLANKQEYENKGRLETVGGLIDTQTGSIQMRALFPNTNGLIRSGSSAVIRVPVTLKDVVIIPSKATYEMQEKLFVYVMGNNGAVKNTEIEVEDIPAGEFYVVKRGLSAGEHIVSEGMGSLKDGMIIKPKISATSR